MKKLLMLTAAVFALQALPALAEDGAKDGNKHDRGGKFFEHMDTNKDGKITEAESVENAKARFKEMDGNSDGSVTKEEMKAHWEAKKAERKAKRDAEKPVDAPAAQ